MQYKSPFSVETQALRRNSLLASFLSLFIAWTGELPKSIAFFGVSFGPDQQSSLGWFLFAVTLYLFLHFLAAAIVEFADWIKPFREYSFTKKELLEHPAYDETDFIDIPEPPDDFDLAQVSAAAEKNGKFLAQRQLAPLYKFFYLKIILEIVVPVLVGCFGLIMLVRLITIGSNGG